MSRPTRDEAIRAAGEVFAAELIRIDTEQQIAASNEEALEVGGNQLEGETETPLRGERSE